MIRLTREESDMIGGGGSGVGKTQKSKSNHSKNAITTA